MRMDTERTELVSRDLATELVGLLHRNAPIEEFAAHLARAEVMHLEGKDSAGTANLVRMAMGVKNRLDMHQLSEQGMLAMFDSAKDLSSRLDTDSLLGAIVTRARNLLGSHVAWLTIHDAEKDEFRVLASDGAISFNTTRMKLSGRLGIASIVLSTRLPFFTQNYLLDNRFPHDPILDDTFRSEGVAGLAGVPLMFDDKVVGLLFIADRYHRTYTTLNVAILSTLATYAAVAINNARAFEHAKDALHRADVAREELEHHAREIQNAAEAHEQLTALLAKGASLGTLSETIAHLLNGSIVILDEAFHVISKATAPGYTGRLADTYAPHSALSAEVTQAIRNSRQGGRSVIAREEDGELCRVIAVIGGNDLLGAVLLFRQGDLGEIPVRTFERSSSIIGIVLLSQERMEASKSRDVSALMRSLITGTRREDLSLTWDRAKRFGLDLAQPASLILVETEGLKPDALARRLRAGSSLSELVLDEIDGALAIIIPTTKIQHTLSEFTAIAKREFIDRYGGIVSRPIQSPAEIPACYTALRRGLAVIGRLGIKGQIIDQNEMALYSVLFESHDQERLKSFIEATIGPLIAYDDKRHTQLADTLLSYMDSNQNARTTATRLGIHVNTVRQRLTSVEELLGYWGNPIRALEIHVALRLWRLS
ncbi:helix-turn-helix domain-containing protein [Noviherbaspirillum galbum]|uniref:GAF domain-containing protein n=1 Tax=Noviherbaspirillum galbum TaxID=2709383 RepID=A0A6B3SPI9_9BURK|nr:helix-turn-helix domain-containing protein [Noviherbaspirillum galbum]NEX62428.1 GAF domain-containing protein [Noviherbaspirillum galbum]